MSQVFSSKHHIPSRSLIFSAFGEVASFLSKVGGKWLRDFFRCIPLCEGYPKPFEPRRWLRMAEPGPRIGSSEPLCWIIPGNWDRPMAYAHKGASR